MARKSVKGYAEKNYYDNTKFTGGIVATNDPLNEGSFKHLVNFDIADTGQSLTPRKGFLTTALKYKQDGVDVEVALSDKTIYYFDANIGKWIFIDFTVFDSTNLVPNMFKVEFDVNNKYISNVEKITNFSTHNLNITPWNNSKASLVSSILPDTYPIYNNYAQAVIDEYSTTQYIIKVKYGDTSICWFTLTYRENESEYEGVAYPADTLVLGCLDTTDVVDTVDTSKRNLASFESIIPNPMQAVYADGEEPLGFIQQFPMIYVKDLNGKYLINTTQTIDGLEVIPNFYLKEPANNTYIKNDVTYTKYQWAYAYDIISTSLDSNLLNNSNVFKSNIFSLDTNNTLVGIFYNLDQSWTDLYTTSIDKISDDFDLVLCEETGTLNHNHFQYFDSNVIKRYINELDVYSNSLKYPEYNHDNTLLLYVIPKPDYKKLIDLPATIAPLNNNIDVLRTTWYTNETYKFTATDDNGAYIEILKNIPEITQAFVNNEGKTLNELHEILKDLDFSKDITFTPEQAYAIYNELAVTYSITVNRTTSSIIENLKTDLDEWFATNDATYINATDLIKVLKSVEIGSTFWFYAKPLSSINTNYTDTDKVINGKLGFDSIVQTALHSDIIAFSERGMTLEELEEYINSNEKYTQIIVNPKKYSTCVKFPKVSNYVLDLNKDRMVEFTKLFPDVFYNEHTYFVCYNYGSYVAGTDRTEFSKEFVSTEYRQDSILNFFTITLNSITEDGNIYNRLHDENLTFIPCLDRKMLPIYTLDLAPSSRAASIFNTQNNLLHAVLNDTKSGYKYLNSLNYFEQGLNIILYFLLVPTRQYLLDYIPDFNSYTRDYFITTTNLFQSRLLTLSSIKPTTYIEYLTEEPTLIKNAKEDFIFRSTLGDHLVLWAENKLYISKESKQYYFPATGYSFSYPETIVKAIQYKDMILVFTTQNLYAVYFTEYVTTVQNGTDNQGNPKYVQQSTYEFATLPVLYNLMVDERYKDAIQVYNQMILFYSADGQMFLIKPTAAIDSNTRFSIQYFNKSVNDILLNYKDYMQERIQHYGRADIITDVKIKVSTSINFIKIFYTAPDIMTYILIYDIINNRYYVYDTLIFSNIVGLHFIPEGELYVVKDKNKVEDKYKIYFTLPYAQPNEPDNNVDIASYDNFSRNAIKSEIDTGVINLNNHLKKRFKDLHVIYKNLNATDLEFSLDTFIDDIPITVYLGNTLEVRNVAGSDTIVLVKDNKVINFLEDNSALFNFLDYSSNKVITHRSNIVSKGKSIRTKMYFTSKGKYKIQGYGLVYKEHTV